jgi:hypothetical protein
MKTDSPLRFPTSSLRRLRKNDAGEKESSAEPNASKSYKTEKGKARHRPDHE